MDFGVLHEIANVMEDRLAEIGFSLQLDDTDDIRRTYGDWIAHEGGDTLTNLYDRCNNGEDVQAEWDAFKSEQ